MVDLENIRKIVTSRELTHEQKLMQLAKAAENSLDVLNIPPRTRHFFETGAINDLFEGGAPYRPRYILPDYEKFVKNGSAFLRVDPPKDLDELLNALMILYRHVPSITNFPVYLGSLDTLIDPFLDGLSDEAASREAEFITVFYGEDVNEEDAHKACDAFTRKCPDAEVNLICGGQPVYYYIISIE